jgi:hypothetical protein
LTGVDWEGFHNYFCAVAVLGASLLPLLLLCNTLVILVIIITVITPIIEEFPHDF